MKTPIKNIVLMIMGGFGKNIIATEVLQALSYTYPYAKLFVATAHPDAWKEYPDTTVLQIDSTYLYKDYLSKEDTKVFHLEPYASEDYYYRRMSLAHLWCKLCEVTPKATKPTLILTDEEIQTTRKKVGDIQKLFLIQTNGGAPNQEFPISWARDLPLPIAEEICIEMKKRGYRPIHLRRANQPMLQNAEWIDMTIRETCALIFLSHKRLFIDSFPQHVAAAFDKPSVVTWIGNDPKVFGYELHTNISPLVKPSFRHTIDSFMEPYNITGNLHEYPYDTDRIYSVEEILKALE